MQYFMFPAIINQHPPPLHTKAGFKRAPGIIDTGMDHFAVAARGLLAELLVALHHENTFMLLRKAAGNGQAYHPGSDNKNVDIQSYTFWV
jgi:hypothetical protein